MLNSKTRLTLFTGLMMALVILLIILAQRFIFPVYLQRIARETILHEADAFLKQTASPPETRVSVQANSLVLLEDFSPGMVYHSSFTRLENALVQHCRQHGFTQGVERLSLNGEELYLLAQRVEATADAPALALLLYVRITPLRSLLRLLNAILLLLLAGFGLLAILSGRRLGRRTNDAQRKLQRMISSVSHEMKTPLGIIQSQAEDICQGQAPDAPAAARSILDTTERMDRLVEELLFFSRVNGETIELKMEPFSIREMLERCACELAPLAVRRKLRLITHLPADLPDYVGDEANLERAVRNVLNNAVRYAQQQITMFAFTLEGQLVIKIKDDGLGISKKDLKHIFERFYAGSSEQTGIGLSLAREIVRLHGGNLEAQNDDPGTVFRFTLPLSDKGKQTRRPRPARRAKASFDSTEEEDYS
ncbi:MAG TPA: HAMP domain-containing sensor histidine kinase [Clostridia bacterium]|nr:HAMP domain-containing sensor histidine kinase [Clostridia bacterium]